MFLRRFVRLCSSLATTDPKALEITAQTAKPAEKLKKVLDPKFSATEISETMPPRRVVDLSAYRAVMLADGSVFVRHPPVSNIVTNAEVRDVRRCFF